MPGSPSRWTSGSGVAKGSPWFCRHFSQDCRPMTAHSRFLLAAALLLGTASAPRAEPVDLALVLALDVSQSVDQREYDLQREGIATAFESPALLAAVAGGKHHAIDVMVLEWSD